MTILKKFGLSFGLTFGLVAAPSPGFAEEVTVPTSSLKKGGKDGAGRFFLLTVGVGTYADDFWPSLKWTGDDARRVSEGFGVGTGLSPWRRSLIDAAATKVAVRQAMQEIRDEVTARDTVVVYVSSHGTLAETDDGELAKVVVLHDTRKDEAMATGMRQAELVDWLDGLAARRRLVVFATCHGGVGKSRLPARVERLLGTAKGEIAPLEDVSEGVLILAASARGEAAREDDRLNGDIYTHFLLEGLATYDRNRDGVVTALEAHDYAKEKTYVYTSGRQRPTAEARFIGEADVPLRGARARRGVPVLEAYDEDFAGFQLQVGNGTKGRLPMAFPLAEDGVSEVTLFGRGEGRELGQFRVKAAPDQTVTLEDILAPPPFLVAVVTGAERWRDERFASLTGKAQAFSLGLTLAYQRRDWFAGIELKMPNADEREVSLGLDVETAWNRIGLVAGRLFQLRPDWRAEVGLLVASEDMRLTFSDSTLEEMSFSSTATIGGVEGGIERELKHGLGLGLLAGYLVGRHEFGQVGDLDATRAYGTLRMNLRFGGVARRL